MTTETTKPRTLAQIKAQSRRECADDVERRKATRLLAEAWTTAFALGAASRASPEATERPETVIQCETMSGPPGHERRCLRFKSHDGRGHLFDDREIQALWFGLNYWYRKACDLEAEAKGRASPEEGRLREALEEMAAQHRCGCGHPACLHDTKEMP